jgi:hypothetical protein
MPVAFINSKGLEEREDQEEEFPSLHLLEMSVFSKLKKAELVFGVHEPSA